MTQIVTGAIGLIVLALFLAFGVTNRAPAIEADLLGRASETLAEHGMDWAQVTMDGRELVVSGIAPTAELRTRAASVANVWGVRTVDNQIRVARAIPPPVEPIPPEPELALQQSQQETWDTCQKELDQLLSDQRIQFEPGSSTMKQDSSALLEQLAAAAQKCPDTQIEIGGHTDSQGSESSNQLLSQARAEAVLSYLSEHGVDASRLSARGYGESNPIADNSNAAGRARNRRIEFKVGGQ